MRPTRALGSAVRPPGSRWLSAVELGLGAAVVVGHNVFQRLPNEVPSLVALGLLSLRLRDGGWAAMGLRRPASWSRLLAIGAAAAVLRLALGEYLIDPLTARFWPPATAPSGVAEITGDPGYALAVLIFVWIFAAFGEEIVYRGYLLTRAADLGRRSPAAYLAAVVATSILFGVGHFYKGPAGMVDTGVAGLVLGGAYLLAGRNLWVSIVAHGLVDTVGIVLLLFGWDE